ncbi:MAG: AmmeMemoRadiSam system protein B [Oscillospiraceae bacterium]|nr:AmmeMemoRadiSam system protein B [Oscillospiraceae bacterium]
MKKIILGFTLLLLLSVTLGGCGDARESMTYEQPQIPEITSPVPQTAEHTPEKIPAETPENTPQTYVNSRLLECLFHEQKDFDIYVSQAQIYEIYETNSAIKSGVVPHHLLAGRMIASFFKTAALTSPDTETVIIVAPIHEAKGTVAATSYSSWATPYGVLYNEQGFTERLADELSANICEFTAENDHSVSALIPFVKYYFPDVTVAYVLVEANAADDFPEKAASLFAEFAKEKNCLFVFSVDFSHYLGPGQIGDRDNETRKAIIEDDRAAIARMTNANIDSPKAILTFLGLNSLSELTLHELEHSNSLEISGIAFPHPTYNEGLTSYFVWAGTK